MENLTLVATLVLVIAAALAGGAVAHRLGQPALLGYILAGVLIGPGTPGLVADHERVELLANLGVAFLMFALGVEFSLEELLRVRRVALFSGGLQIVATTIFGTLVGLLVGWPFPAAALLGGATAISSSIVAVKLLVGRGEAESAQARVAMGVGVVQDLSVVPMLALLPLLTGAAGNLPLTLARSLGTAAIALIVVVLGGMKLVPRILYLVARTGSRELFLMMVVVIALGTGLASQMAGLSFALGAFLAGIVVSASEFDGQVLADIIPLRDLFATIFFVAVGMLIDPVFVGHHAGIAFLLVGAAVAGKLAIATGALLAGGVDPKTATLAAAVLAQMGEFSFVLAGIGLSAGIIVEEQYGIMLAVALESIVLAPILLLVAPRLVRVTRRLPGISARDRALADAPAPGPLPADAVVCGYGRVGAELGAILRRNQTAFTVVDLNPAVVHRLRADGVRALYGDAGAEPVLTRAGVAQARVLAVAIPDLVTAAAAIRAARALNPRIRVIALADSSAAVRTLEALGANDVVQPEFEASMGFVRQTLRWLGAAAPEARVVVVGERHTFYDQDHPERTRPAKDERAHGRDHQPHPERPAGGHSPGAARREAKSRPSPVPD
ncbi:MAG TPA: cation:proton antiporter [Thermomicrobiales bacterium]|nr:cation:proton antiporter [Thermomicrobiales bacterium]